MDSDVAPDARSVFVNQVTTELVGKNQVESIARQIGNKGEIAILSATANATNQNAWIKVMKETLKDPKYKDIKLVKVAYGDDDDQKSFQETQGLIQAYPNLKGIISPTTVGVAAAARYLSTSPQKGKVKLTGLGFPNQMRKFVKDGTVEEFQLWVPKDVGYLAGQAAAALVAGRITGKEGEKFKAGRLGDYTIGKNGEIVLGPLTTFNEGQHRRLRLLSRAHGNSSIGGLRDRPGRRYWPQFDGLKERIEGYQRRVEERVAELGGEVVSAGLVDTRAGRARGGRPLRRRAGRPRALPRRHLRHLEHGAPGGAGGEGRRSCCSACSRRRASTTPTPTPASGWPTARPAACPRSRARSPARGIPYDTVAGTIDDDERAWEKIGALGARGRRRARAAALADRLPRARLSGHARHVHRLHRRSTPQIGAHVEVLEIDDLGARVAQASDAEVAAKDAEIRAMFAFADPSDDPIAGPIEPEALDWSARVAVGLDRLVDGLRARRADLLLPRHRRQRGRAPRRRRDRRQLAADRARDPDRGRGATSRPTSPS